VSHRTRAIAVLSCVQIGLMDPVLRAKLCSVMEEHIRVRTANLDHLVDELRKLNENDMAIRPAMLWLYRFTQHDRELIETAFVDFKATLGTRPLDRNAQLCPQDEELPLSHRSVVSVASSSIVAPSVAATVPYDEEELAKADLLKEDLAIVADKNGDNGDNVPATVLWEVTHSMND